MLTPLLGPHNHCHILPSPVYKISLDPTSTLLAARIRGWMNECSKKHSSCKQYASKARIMPKRLLRVNGSNMCLISPSVSVPFAALSYCWGSTQQSTTTNDNIAERFNNINHSDLQQTLKDAVLITRMLGLQYIWIDSLCIIQDNQDDWATEAGTMADIFAGAHIVLAATRAKDVSDGFLNPRTAPITIKSAAAGKGSFSFQARRIHHHSYFNAMLLDDLPLFKRGWCMQEILLSCRILHFCQDEVYYECKTGGRCECGLADSQAGKRLGFTMSPPETYINTTHMKVEFDTIAFPQQWCSLVSHFTSLQLKYVNDKLPALSGLAQHAQYIQPGAYIAGIWEKGLAYYLSWHLDPSHLSTIPCKANKLNNPTFSWITARGPVKHTWFTNPFLNLSTSDSLCVLLASQVRLATSDPFGMVDQAQIRIQGRAVPALDLFPDILDPRRGSHALDDKSVFKRTISISLDSGVEFSFMRSLGMSELESTYEGLLKARDWTNVLCFGLYTVPKSLSSRSEPPDAAVLLLVEQVAQGDLYRRVGLAWYIDLTWFEEHATACTITIE